MISADIYHYDSIDSTNSEARRKVNEGISLPAVFVADKQTAGRGRRGKTFFSSGGLYMSLAIDTAENDIVLLTTSAAVYVAEAIEEVIGISVGIKWVNDLYYNGKKVCGILCETVTDPSSGKLRAVIIGIGINLNVPEFPDELKDIAGAITSPDVSSKTLSKVITEKLLSMKNGEIINKYKERSIVLGKEISYEKNGKLFLAKAVDIDDFGGLVVEHEDKHRAVLNSGEITIRLI